MTPERWQQIEQLYHAALEREESQRAAYLYEVCAGDNALGKWNRCLRKRAEQDNFSKHPPWK